jgi:nicotinamide-nucleotide amidase
VLTVELLTVSGDPADATVDAAVAVGRWLEREGAPVRGRRVVPADEEAVVRALGHAVDGGGLVLATGRGEGATALRQGLARVLGSRLVLSERALEALAGVYAARGRAMPRRAEQLALVPQGATVLLDAAADEPGLLAEVGPVTVAVLPASVPAALALARAHLAPRLTRAGAGGACVVRTLRLVGLEPGAAEGQLAGVLRGVDGASGQVIEGGEELWARVRVRAESPAGATAAFEALRPALRGAFGPAWYGTDDERLEAVVGDLLRARGWTLALAESCTGGLVGHRLTEVPGSSAYVDRGFVVYSNAAKQAMLGVSETILARHGAVSAACAEAMARGARERAGTDLGLSVTGIAGPDGGTPTKPVGTVFIGLADARGAVVEPHRFTRDRAGNKALSATHALDLVRRRCLEVT